MSLPFTLYPGALVLADLRKLWSAPAPLALDPRARPGVEAAAACVDRVIASGETVYGVNTGFGLLARTRIDDARLAELQRALVLSHSAGTGALLDDAVVLLVIALKAASLARGHSGVRWRVIEALVALANAGIVPCIPAQGSVGASGDLAPLAHLAAVLIGEGEAKVAGRIVPARDALAAQGLEPVALGPKEGLALLNGTQVSTALALAGLFAAERAMAGAFVAGALAVDACLGSDTPFDPRIHAVRQHRGQGDAAMIYRTLLADSSIRASHKDCHRVQDPYSLRCQPQVMGACLDQMRHAAGVLLQEANAVSDNPLVFAGAKAGDGDILSGGNFHAEPVAFAADNLALAIAETGALSERRTALLMDTHMSGLPPFLVTDGGVNSGFMIAQVTAAALASENKSLAHPGERRFAADVGESGGSCEHGDLCCAPPRADGRQYRRHRRDRTARRRAGRRPAQAAGDVAPACRSDDADPRAGAVLGTRSRLCARPRRRARTGRRRCVPAVRGRAAGSRLTGHRR